MQSFHAEKLLSISEAADFLGVKVNTLYSWVHTRKIPYVKVGRLVRFDLAEIKSWLQDFVIKPWEGWRNLG